MKKKATKKAVVRGGALGIDKFAKGVTRKRVARKVSRRPVAESRLNALRRQMTELLRKMDRVDRDGLNLLAMLAARLADKAERKLALLKRVLTLEAQIEVEKGRTEAKEL